MEHGGDPGFLPAAFSQLLRNLRPGCGAVRVRWRGDAAVQVASDGNMLDPGDPNSVLEVSNEVVEGRPHAGAASDVPAVQVHPDHTTRGSDPLQDLVADVALDRLERAHSSVRADQGRVEAPGDGLDVADGCVGGVCDIDEGAMGEGGSHHERSSWGESLAASGGLGVGAAPGEGVRSRVHRSDQAGAPGDPREQREGFISESVGPFEGEPRHNLARVCRDARGTWREVGGPLGVQQRLVG